MSQGVWHTDQCSYRVVGLEGCATMSSSARQVVRGERRSLQVRSLCLPCAPYVLGLKASLKLAAEKSLPPEEREPAASPNPSRQRDIINAGRSSIGDPSPVPAFERSKQCVAHYTTTVHRSLPLSGLPMSATESLKQHAARPARRWTLSGQKRRYLPQCPMWTTPPQSTSPAHAAWSVL